MRGCKRGEVVNGEGDGDLSNPLKNTREMGLLAKAGKRKCDSN